MTTNREAQQPQENPPEQDAGSTNGGHELQRTAMLAEIGLNFAEMIHDLRQPLTGIQGFAQLIGEHPDSPKVGAWAGEIVRESRRMQSMMERMRLFFRPAAPHTRSDQEPLPPADLCKAASEAVRLMPRLPPGIELKLELPEGGVGKVAMPRDSLVRILWNLLLNARDAIQDKAGRGTSDDSGFSLPTGTMLLKAERTDEGAAILVADQGAGIPEAIRASLFQPFATSKGDRGTGLGLFICRKLAQESGGSLTIVPPPKGFTTAFRLVIPKGG